MSDIFDTGLFVGGRRVFAARDLDGPLYICGKTNIYIEDTGTPEGNLALAEEAARNAPPKE